MKKLVRIDGRLCLRLLLFRFLFERLRKSWCVGSSARQAPRLCRKCTSRCKAKYYLVTCCTWLDNRLVDVLEKSSSSCFNKHLLKHSNLGFSLTVGAPRINLLKCGYIGSGTQRQLSLSLTPPAPAPSAPLPLAPTLSLGAVLNDSHASHVVGRVARGRQATLFRNHILAKHLELRHRFQLRRHEYVVQCSPDFA